jgi:hypothetical protein
MSYGPPTTGPDPGLEQVIQPQPQGLPAGAYPPGSQAVLPQDPGAVPGTLGQTNQAMLPPGNPIMNQYADAIQGMLTNLRPFMEQPKPPQPGPSFLESLGTFGIANLKHIADENSRREENYRILQRNRQIGMQGVGLAVRAVDAQATAAGLAARQNIALQHLTLEQQRFISDLQEKQKTEARLGVNDEFKFRTIPAPMTPDAMDAAAGQGYGPSTRFPGRWERIASMPGDAGVGGGGAGGGGGGPRLTRQPDGSWAAPAPGSPMDTKLGQVGGGGGGAAGTDPLAQRPGESTADWIRRKQTAQKTAVPTSATRTRAETAPKVLQLLGDARKAMQAAAGTGMGLGPGASRFRSYKTGAGFADPSFMTYADTVGALHSLLMSMHTGSRSSELLLKKFEKMADPSVQSPENMNAAFGMIEKYARDVARAGGQPLPEEQDAADSGTATDTTTSTTPPSTGAPTQSTGATQPTSLDDLLKKHGY